MTTTDKSITPTTARGKRLVAAGFKVLREVGMRKFAGIDNFYPGKWYEVITPTGQAAVVGYQSARIIHVFGAAVWTASGNAESNCHKGGLGDAIDTDAQLRGYRKLVLACPVSLRDAYEGLYRASSDAYNEEIL